MPTFHKTATTSGPCACCGTGTATLFCRTRGGTASLVGCGEVVNPSIPARAFRHGFNTGYIKLNLYGNAACSGAFTVYQCDYSGTFQYNPTTGAVTYGGATICNGVPVGVGVGCYSACPVDCNVVYSCDQTSWTGASSGACCSNGTGSWSKAVDVTQAYQMDDEDFESDAISRLLAGAGGVWSSYTEVGDGTGGTCLAASCCKAQYQQRTTGFSFAYGEAQFRCELTNLDPLTAYVVNFQVYRRLQGSSDPWVLLFDSPYGFTTDASGNYTITDEEVPNLIGYETHVCCPFVYKP